MAKRFAFVVSTGACRINRPCAQQYVGKSQSCMVISGRLIVHAPVVQSLSMADWLLRLTRQGHILKAAEIATSCPHSRAKTSSPPPLGMIKPNPFSSCQFLTSPMIFIPLDDCGAITLPPNPPPIMSPVVVIALPSTFTMLRARGRPSGPVPYSYATFIARASAGRSTAATISVRSVQVHCVRAALANLTHAYRRLTCKKVFAAVAGNDEAETFLFVPVLDIACQFAFECRWVWLRLGLANSRDRLVRRGSRGGGKLWDSAECGKAAIRFFFLDLAVTIEVPSREPRSHLLSAEGPLLYAAVIHVQPLGRPIVGGFLGGLTHGVLSRGGIGGGCIGGGGTGGGDSSCNINRRTKVRG